MKILFLIPHGGLLRNFESTLRLLLERGHAVDLALDTAKYESSTLKSLDSDFQNLRVSVLAEPQPGRWHETAQGIRSARDYTRYLGPMYADAPKLRARARRKLPSWLATAVDVLSANAPGAAKVRWLLDSMSQAIPQSSAALKGLARGAPDALIVTPLFGSLNQLEYVRAARTLGIPSALLVASWDNLTNKGLIGELPDLVTVWNDFQRSEGELLHGIPHDRLSVTGAPGLDEWFERSPASERSAFCERVGLRDDLPFLLYLGSSKFIAPQEVPFFERWLAFLRTHDDRSLRGIGVLIRPHPQNARQWLDLSPGDEQLAVWPDPRLAPELTRSADWPREDFYDSLYHSASVVGVNTTAMIESAIVGREVFTVLDEEFRDTQNGTPHFRHLTSVGNGLLHVADDLSSHGEQLSSHLARSSTGNSREFVEAFVRPHGLDRPATPILVDAIEQVLRREVPPARLPARTAGLRLLLEPVALAVSIGHPATRRGRRVARRGARLTRRKLTRPARRLVRRQIQRPARRLVRRQIQRAKRLAYLLLRRLVGNDVAPRDGEDPRR